MTEAGGGPGAPEGSNERLERLARRAVHQHLRDAGLPASENGMRVDLGFGGLATTASLSEPVAGNERLRIVPLGFLVQGWSGGDIAFSLAGTGATTEEATLDAAHGFLDSVVPVLRLVTGESDALPGVVVEPLYVLQEGRGSSAQEVQTWEVIAGPAGLGSDDLDALAAQLDAQPLISLLLPWVLAATPYQRPLWIKVYMMSMRERPGGTQANLSGEVTMLNVPDPPAFELLRAFNWPAEHPFGVVRQFLIVRPRPDLPVDPTMAAELLARQKPSAPEAPAQRPRRWPWQRFVSHQAAPRSGQ